MATAMDAGFFLKGFVIGLLISTPVGPLGVLCIRRTMTEGRLVGLISGLGAASADGVYAVLAAFGLTFVSGYLTRGEVLLRAIGGIILLCLGLRIFLARPALSPDSPKVLGLARDFASTFALALSNPMIILSLAAIFAGMGLTLEKVGFTSMGFLAGGVFSGSAFWWIILSLTVTVLRVRFGEGELRWINRISGAVITLFGSLVLLSVGLWHR